jgi:anti-anti-sigma factor
MYLATEPRAGQDDRRVRPDVAPDKLDVDEREQNGVRVVSLRGELDLATAPAACVRLDEARRTPRPRVVVDLSGLKFCDSTGLRALVGAASEVRAAAGRLAVVVPEDDGPIGRLLAVSGVRETLRVHDSMDTALAAV